MARWRRKDSGELVTVADVAAERAISCRLIEHLPGSIVIGEEAVDADPGLLERLHDPDPVWLVDPIDGTGNFAKGDRLFAVMVALVRSCETLAAWIHDPISGSTAVAEKGAGAYLDGGRLRLSAPPPEIKGTLHAGQFASPAMYRLVRSRRDRLNTIHSLSCAGHEYLSLARGDIQFTLFTKTKPWDHAPGGLIFGEAGGLGLTLDGRPYRPGQDSRPGLLLSTDRATWDHVYQALFDGIDLTSLYDREGTV